MWSHRTRESPICSVKSYTAQFTPSTCSRKAGVQPHLLVPGRQFRRMLRIDPQVVEARPLLP